MSEHEALIARMVDAVVEKGYLKTPRIEDAFRAVARHPFLPGVPLGQVYSGEAIPTRHDEQGTPTSSSSEPGVMAVMLEQLKPAPGQRWLEIGAGTGYNAALLAWLVRPDGAVTTVEVQEDVAREAEEHLRVAGFPDVRVVAGDGWMGVPERAPFDRIEATASVDDLSPYWARQLAPNGLLLVPLRLGRWSQALVAFRMNGDRLVSESIQGGGFMPLQGHGAVAPGRSVSVVAHPWSLSLPDDVELPVRAVAALLRETPRISAPIPCTYYAWAFLELEVKDAVPAMLVDQRVASPGVPPRRRPLGLLDPRGPALVASDDDRSVAFGARDLEERLRELISSVSGERRIEAVPAARLVEVRGARVLHRGNYQFILRRGGER